LRQQLWLPTARAGRCRALRPPRCLAAGGVTSSSQYSQGLMNGCAVVPLAAALRDEQPKLPAGVVEIAAHADEGGCPPARKAEAQHARLARTLHRQIEAVGELLHLRARR